MLKEIPQLRAKERSEIVTSTETNPLIQQPTLFSDMKDTCFPPTCIARNLTSIEHVGSDGTLLASEITGQHSWRRIALRAQLLCLFLVIDRVIKFMIRGRVQEIASDTIHPRVLNDNRVTARAALLDIRTLAIGVAIRVANGGAHVLDPGAWLLTDPHKKHGFDGGEISLGLRVVTFRDALSIAAGEQVVTHDPAAAFTIRCPDGVAIGVKARSPSG